MYVAKMVASADQVPICKAQRPLFPANMLIYALAHWYAKEHRGRPRCQCLAVVLADEDTRHGSEVSSG